jgi:putative ABC transport system permease protein
VNSFLVRLALRGSRGSIGRLLGIVFGMTVGTALIVLLLGVSAGINRRDTRGSWITNVRGVHFKFKTDAMNDGSTINAAQYYEDYRGRSIIRLDVAAAQTNQVSIPGVPRAPMPGEYFVSPGLSQLLKTTSRDQLADRFGQTQAGVIDRDALGSPNSLAVIVGVKNSTLHSHESARTMEAFERPISPNGRFFQFILVIGAIAIMFPVIVLIGITSQLGAAARNDRFATLRLIGASPRQIAAMVGLETGFASTLGAIAGILLALAIRPMVATISIEGVGFLPSDLALTPFVLLTIVLAISIISTLSAIRSVLRLGISPLGAARQIKERPPTARRFLPLAFGLAGIALAPEAAKHGLIGGNAAGIIILAGFFLTAGGLIMAGPWLTFQASRILARRAQSPAGLISAKRILSEPSATFRVASGLVIAIFVVSFFFGAMSTAKLPTPTKTLGRIPKSGLIAEVKYSSLIPDALLGAIANLKKSPGVRNVSVIYQSLQSSSGDIVACSDTQALDLPPCSMGSQYAAFNPDIYTRFEPIESAISPLSRPIGPTDHLTPSYVVAITDGTPTSIDRTRTTMQRTLGGGPASGMIINSKYGVIQELSFLAHLGAFLSISIAGCSLAVAAIIAMTDRKRIFGLLRLIGMPVSDLRRIIVYEAATPLVAVTFFSAALGYCVAAMIFKSPAVQAPEPAYYAVIGLGLAFAGIAIGSTLPMIRKTTGVTSTRFE